MFSLGRSWWSPAGLAYCVGPNQVDRCIELQMMTNALVAFADIPPEARSKPEPPEHPLKRVLWGVRSGVKMCDRRREGQLDYCCVISTSGATPDTVDLDSDDSSPHATKQRLLTADISADRKHFAFIDGANALVVQELRPKGVDHFVVKTLYKLALGEKPARQLWWTEHRIALRLCSQGLCTLATIDPMNPKATVTTTDIAIGLGPTPLHPIDETLWAIVSDTGEKVHFFDAATGKTSSTLTLPRRSAEGVWSGKSGPFELALVYGKPNLGDVVRVHLQKREVSAVNTAACD